MMYLLLGGSKSGKSMLAQNITKSLGGTLYYLATMDPTDAEDDARIARHREERRGWGYETVEQARNLPACFDRIEKNGTVLLDSVTSLLAQEMFLPDRIDTDAGLRTARELIALGKHAKNVVFVSDQIFSDGITFDETTEEYRRQLAQVCIQLAQVCDGVAEVTAGIPKWHKGEWK